MKILFVTDALDGLQPEIDATVGLMAAAQAHHVEVWVCTPESLSVAAGRVHARTRRIALRPRSRGCDHRWQVQSPWFEAVDTAVVDVADTMALVLLRIDPPVDTRYLHTTYLLDLVEVSGVPVVNRPDGVRALHEKAVALQMPDLCPATTVTTDARELLSFLARVGRAVIKPVDGFAGNDVWLLRDGDPSAVALLDSATSSGRRHVIAQQYLDAVTSGNKRLFVLDGEIIAAVLRRPARDDFRIGPPVAATEPDDADRRIVRALAPRLKAHGIVLAGIDVIAGQLIEVNVTCPGGMHKADALLGTDLSGAIVRRLLHDERVPA